MATNNRFAVAMAAIDAAHAEDPEVEATIEGREVPKELLYAERMTRRLEKLEPEASELLRLAARAQHIRRWSLARADYPKDRAGYRRWRSDCAKMHSEVTKRIMGDAGYDDAAINRVSALLQKKKLKVDKDVQTLEDVACLVFLEHYFADFATEHAAQPEKLVDILRKTWIKMSDRGCKAALAVPLRDSERALVERAMAG